MALKIKQALEKLVDDLASVEVATLQDGQQGQSVVGYTKISIEGDTVSFVDSNMSSGDQQAHLNAVDKAVADRDIMIKFLIGTLKSL